MDIKEALKICEEFATKYKVIFEEKGEVGFGRNCVGFIKGTNYVNFNPHNSDKYEFIPELQCDVCYPPEEVKDAYHKHDCLSVLVYGEDYDKAIIQLAKWVLHLKGQGEVSIKRYDTGAVGIQAIISGLTGYCVYVKE